MQISNAELRINPPVPRFPRRAPPPPHRAASPTLEQLSLEGGASLIDDGRSIKPALPKAARRPASARAVVGVHRRAPTKPSPPPSFAEWAQSNAWAMGGPHGRTPPQPVKLVTTPWYKASPRLKAKEPEPKLQHERPPPHLQAAALSERRLRQRIAERRHEARCVAEQKARQRVQEAERAAACARRVALYHSRAVEKHLKEQRRHRIYCIGCGVPCPHTNTIMDEATAARLVQRAGGA